MAVLFPPPAELDRIDAERRRRYAGYLAFYDGAHWQGRPRRGERRLTFNYARAFVDKVVSYLLGGLAVQVDPADGADPAGRERARAAERALRAVEADQALAQLDFETELDCAVLGDAAYRVSWDSGQQRVRVTAPDVQGLFAWRRPDDLREPKQAWGASDLPPLMESNRELNRAFSQLSQILELSGNPIAVLEGVSEARDIAVEPGAVWEVPERARAYLLDLLQGGGVALHRDYIDLIYRTMHDLGESPRTAFGHNSQGLSGVALNTELDPLAKKVARKRLIRTAVYERRAQLILELLGRFAGLDIAGVRPRVQWGPVLPVDRSRQVADERVLVGAGIASRRTAAARLGSDDPEAEWLRVLEERSDFEVPTSV